ncbi:MAG TPA: DUF1800 family protein [Solirubrobacteraceae bacterium]|nr:DUF1800 family protein [Solirubrobacteraceae bacterium]
MAEELKRKKRRKRKRCRIVKKTKVVDGRRKVVKVRKCRKKRPKPAPAPGTTHPPAVVVAPPAPGPAPAIPPPPPPPPPALKTIVSPIGVYTGTFGRRQAERLLWRAGFGPRPGQAEALAALGLEAAVMSLTRPAGTAVMDGPEPMVGGLPFTDPFEEWYGDTLYWFDRMVRSRHQLIERLALVFHDWWATSNAAVGDSELTVTQTNIFRTHGLGSFADMTRAITTDPAMLLFLNGIENRKGAINENYGRELMELFTLGADRGAYTETDVRELSRALSGWRADWVFPTGWQNFRWVETRWDAGTKTVFGKTGAFGWEDACRLVIEHPLHASFFVTKLWSYFIPVAPSADVQAKLEQLYVSSGHQIRPVLEAILCCPEFHEGPRMVKPAAVYAAGLLRALDKPITGEHWVWLTEGAGQRLYYPPDVSGWDDKRWLDTNTIRARWDVANYALQGSTYFPSNDYPAETPEQALAKARAVWGDPHLTSATVASLAEFAATFPADTPGWVRAQRQNALRQLIAASPDYQTC